VAVTISYLKIGKARGKLLLRTNWRKSAFSSFLLTSLRLVLLFLVVESFVVIQTDSFVNLA
jgi:hypothetical protein